MYKLIGAVMTIGACTLTGHAVAKAFAGRPRQLRALRSSLQELETEIVYGAVPMLEALEHLAARGDPLVRKFYSLVLTKLQNIRGGTVAEAWSIGLEEWQGSTYLTEDDLATFRVLGNSLGTSDRLDQQKHLKLAGEKLALGEAGAWEVAAKTVKPWNYLGLLGGIVIVLIFI